jgi:hypothetical protein
VNQQPFRLTEEVAFRNARQKVHVLALEGAEQRKKGVKPPQAINPIQVPNSQPNQYSSEFHEQVNEIFKKQHWA